LREDIERAQDGSWKWEEEERQKADIKERIRPKLASLGRYVNVPRGNYSSGAIEDSIDGIVDPIAGSVMRPGKE
jgi:hypothetical protein